MAEQVDIAKIIEDHKQQIAIQPKRPLPNLASRLIHHPGFLGYALRTEDEYNDAVRHDQLVRRLREVRQQYPEQFRSTVAGQNPDGTPIYWGQVPIDHDTTPSAYRWRGYGAPGQPLREGSDVVRSVFSIPANTFRVAFSKPEKREDAKRQFGAMLDNMVGGLGSAAQGKDMNPAWAKDTEKPFAALDRLTDVNKRWNPFSFLEATESETRPGIMGATQAMLDSGIPDSTATRLTGGVLDSISDPNPAGLFALKAARAGKAVPAIRNLLLEFGPNAAINYLMGGEEPPTSGAQ